MTAWTCYRASGAAIPDDGVWNDRLRVGAGADRVQALAWLDRTVADDLAGLRGWRSGYWQLIHNSAVRALGNDASWQYVLEETDWPRIAWALIVERTGREAAA
jgi:hypothetical protein